MAEIDGLAVELTLHWEGLHPSARAQAIRLGHALGVVRRRLAGKPRKALAEARRAQRGTSRPVLRGYRRA